MDTHLTAQKMILIMKNGAIKRISFHGSINV